MVRTRALTETVNRPDVSLLVEEYRCKTHSLLNQIGANASHRIWTVRALGHGLEDDALETIDGSTAWPGGAARNFTFYV